MKLNRRQVMQSLLLPAAASLAAPFVARPARAEGSLTVASFGGRFQDMLREALFKPFQEATGIAVNEATGTGISKIKAMVMTNSVEIDVMEVVPAEFLVLAGQDLLEEIDYGKLDKTVMAQLNQDSLHKYGVGFLYFSQVVAYNTKTFPKERHPASWADVWDLQGFPGKRILPAGDYVVNPIEPALLAAGVPKDALYPLDLDEAYASLAKVRPAVIKWVNSSSAVPQALVDGEADVGMAAAARIIDLRDQGAAVDFDWNQAIITHDYLAVPKGAPNYENALRFIDFVSQAKVIAGLCKLMAFGPNNREAFQYLTDAEKARMPTEPATLAKSVALDPEWWAGVGGDGKSNVERNLALWNAWITAG